MRAEQLSETKAPKRSAGRTTKKQPATVRAGNTWAIKTMAYTKLYGNREEQLARMTGQGWKILTFKSCSLVIAFDAIQVDRVHVKAWTGAADKPSWYYCFRSMANAEEYTKRFENTVKTSEANRTQRTTEKKAARAELKASNFWTVGEVVYNSWGYDQTNVDFYQVIEVKAKSIVIQEVKQNNSDSHNSPYGGQTQPRRNEFHGKPILKIVDENGNIRFEFGGATKWDGKPKYTSSNH